MCGGRAQVQSVQPSGVAQANQWQFVYDAAGDRVETIDPNAHKRDWAYDVMGRTINAYEYPQTGTTLTTGYDYDADSQLVSVDDPRGFVTGGIGLLMPMGGHGLYLRGEGRMYAQRAKATTPCGASPQGNARAAGSKRRMRRLSKT